MPMSIAFRWRTPNISAPQSTVEKNNVNENLQSIGNSIFQMKLGRRMEDDRQRRIAEEERQKKLYGETADMIRGKAAERETLVKERDRIINEINALKAQMNNG